MTYRTLDDVDVTGQRVLVRVDLNLPMKDGTVTDSTRIDRVVPTIGELSDKGAKVILCAHFGRPKGERVPEMSLEAVLQPLSKALNRPVSFCPDAIGPNAAAVAGALNKGDILLLENTRFYPGEEKNDPAFAEALAANADLYVNDAFSAAHRAHGSTEGVAHHLPAYAGRAMEAELSALTKALEAPERPVMAVVGGAKISTKLDLLRNLMKKVDVLVIGGGMANTFLAAQGKPVGQSLCEHDLGDTARAILSEAKGAACEIVLPTDCVVAGEFKAHAEHRTIAADAVGPEDMILDIGPETARELIDRLAQIKTVVWNGPLGAFEIAPFDQGTVQVAKAAATATKEGRLTSVAGGGDTVAALNAAGVSAAFTYISAAGGAFLEWLEGKDLPGVAVLKV